MSAMNRLNDSRRRGGFTMVELVIAVIIIAILVAITVPILQERANQAKLTAAKSDLENLANAEERAALDTGYMYRLFVLDDVGVDPANDNFNDPDAFSEEMGRDYPYDVNQSNFFINPRTGRFVENAITIFDRLDPSNAETDYVPSLLNVESGVWNGPYVNWSRDNEPAGPDDIPNDPWGNNYVLFTQAGIIWEDPENPPNNSRLRTAPTLGGLTYEFRLFDRPTALSMGPDGLPGGEGDRRFGFGDDLIRQW